MLSSSDHKTIKNSVLFKSIPDEMAGDIIRVSAAHAYGRGETVFLQGDTANHMYVVLDGWIKLTRITPAGDEVVVTVYSAGQSFAEAAALRNGFFPVSAGAVSDCRLLKVPSAGVLKAIRTEPELGIAILASTFHHLHELVLQIEDMKALSGLQRLAAFLMGLAPVEEGSCTFSLPYDKVLIAGRLGMKPESLSRAFSRLKEYGVTVSRNKIAISRVEVLHDFVAQEKTADWQISANQRA